MYYNATTLIYYIFNLLYSQNYTLTINCFSMIVQIVIIMIYHDVLSRLPAPCCSMNKAIKMLFI